jgi:hypothetical protein
MDLSPFQEFSIFFGSDDLSAMTAAYDAVWYQLKVAGLMASPEQTLVVKKKLAQVILACACTGGRGRDRLEGVALRALRSKLLTTRA